MPTRKARTITDIRSFARSFTEPCLLTLGAYINSPNIDPEIKIRAIGMLLDRGWGKPNQPHTGDDGGDIRVTIRTIIEGKKK
jgi:hypothetical protein